MTNRITLEYVAYIYNNLSGLACAVVCDKEYPPRVAFALINRCIEQFTSRYPRELWTSGDAFEFKELEEIIKTYQDPVKADPILKVQKDLDETKIILVCFLPSLMCVFVAQNR